MLANKTIGFLGGGNMAEAILSGLLSQSPVEKSFLRVSDHNSSRLTTLETKYGIETESDNIALVKWADVIILAVKPQVLPLVLQEIAERVTSGLQKKLFVSIAAGVSVDRIQSHIGQGVRIIRTMPNTPALVRAGATVLSPGKLASDSDMATARALFDTVGTTEVLSENKLDAVTGLSGGGPAFVFVMLEAMADAGVKLGLPREVALKLAAQTVYGSAKLLLDTDGHPGQLKDMVTSPGGTTIAGIHALERGGFRSTIINAIEAAAKRSAELGQDE
ncbi:MAG: pyrroline-5-carboxylate reductase [Kofleriaceae bacterium]|nr:pyrroline-5-carboxylate reductase [Kofleriaceae bacterium]